MIKLEWVVFVALKIIELATIIFLPYFVGKRILDEDEENKLLLWAMGGQAFLAL